MTDDNLTRAINQIDLPELIAELYPESKAIPGKKGTYFAVWRGNQNTPAFSVFQNKGTWFYSDKGGDNEDKGTAFHFLTNIHGLSHVETLEYIENRTGIIVRDLSPGLRRKDISYYEGTSLQTCNPEVLERHRNIYQLSKDLALPDELRRRGLSASDIKRYGLHHDPSRVYIPITDPFGSVVNIKWRATHNTGQRYGYITEGNGASCIYLRGVDGKPFINVLRATRLLFLIEGEFNAMAFDSVMNETSSTYAVMGLAGIHAKLHNIDLSNTRVYVYLDNDSYKGNKHHNLLHAIIGLNAREIYLLKTLGEKDFCDIAGSDRDDAAVIFYDLFLDAKKNYDIDEDNRIGYFTIKEMKQDREEMFAGVIKYRTPIPELDGVIYGWHPIGINLVNALSGHGKSTLMRQAALELSMRGGHKIVYYTTDQSPDAIYLSFASLLCGIPQTVFLSQSYPKSLLEEFGSPENIKAEFARVHDYCLYHLPKLITVEQKFLVNEVLKDIDEKTRYRGYGVVMIDYLQQLAYEDSDTSPSLAMNKLRELSHIHKIPMVCASQLAKSKFGEHRESGIPIITDIEGSGAYYQLSENAIFIYNQDQYMKDFNLDPDRYKVFSYDLVGKAILLASKARRSGSQKATTNWVPAIPRFDSLVYPSYTSSIGENI